jgi:ABC-2 type transport system permease protein
MNARRFSWTRWVSIVIKEFIQLKRDRLTFGMIVGIPVIQVLLFGFAINSDPKSLPTALVSLDNGRYTRTIVSALSNTGYFRFVREASSVAEADELIERGQVQFVVTIPAGFERALVRGDRPQLLTCKASRRIWRRHPRRWTYASSAASIRKASPRSTSCPACSA